MADAAAKSSAPFPLRRRIGPAIAFLAIAVAACNNNPFLNLNGSDPAASTGSTQSTQTQATGANAPAVDQMSTAVAIRDAACYSDFELANQAIETKLNDSIRNITVSGDVGENALRDEMILGLRFNANLQKRLAFDTLEECLR